jgi:antitoxin (DNA-binding transcriptional repressor) of toxin-antitoxin stability system
MTKISASSLVLTKSGEPLADIVTMSKVAKLLKLRVVKVPWIPQGPPLFEEEYMWTVEGARSGPRNYLLCQALERGPFPHPSVMRPH